MLTIAQSLQAISLYPINPLTIQNIVEDCGLNMADEATAEKRASTSYRRAKARVYLYLAQAPAVTEAGSTYSFTDEERKQFRNAAADLLAGESENNADTLTVGYVGENF